VAETIEAALEAAWSGDPLSAFGSVLAFTRPINLAAANFLVEGNRFVLRVDDVAALHAEDVEVAVAIHVEQGETATHDLW